MTKSTPRTAKRKKSARRSRATTAGASPLKSGRSPRLGQLPGDRSLSEDVARMIRVNHAGEFGAQRIYAGQIAVLGESKAGPTLRHMAEQETRHLAAFEDLMRVRGVRPTALQPLWSVAGYALGALCARLGEKAAMACTVAVEEVIDEHYLDQVRRLPASEAKLKRLIERFRDEELEHRDIGLDHGAEDLAYFDLLKRLVRAGSKTAIWLSERI